MAHAGDSMIYGLGVFLALYLAGMGVYLLAGQCKRWLDRRRARRRAEQEEVR